jgi:hypothetical protein
MRNYFCYIIPVCFFLSSCTPVKPLTSDVKPDEISELKLLEPYSYISLIRRGNIEQADDSLSYISSRIMIDVLEDSRDLLPLSGDIFLTDNEINKSLEKEFEDLIMSADEDGSISDLKITPTLDKVLEANQTRFGLIIINTGFTRVKGNYGKQIATEFLLGLLNLGEYAEDAVKSSSTVYAMIADSQEDNIAFFMKSTIDRVNPLDSKALKKQCRKIFEGYFRISD